MLSQLAGDDNKVSPQRLDEFPLAAQYKPKHLTRVLS